MAVKPSHYLSELLSPWAAIEIKRMFGGLGAWRDGQFFGLIARDIVYFKVDDTTRPDYAARLSEPFSYPRTRKGETVTQIIDGWWRVPDEVLEDPDMLADWAQKSWDIARLKNDDKPRQKTSSDKGFSGLGRKSLLLLKAIGITSGDDLHQTGAIAAYQHLKARFGNEISLNMLWALYAAVNQLKLEDVTPDIKDHLKALLTAE